MRDSQPRIIRDIVLGFLITAALVSVKIGVEHTSYGHRAEMFAFELLQGQLSPLDPHKALPVVVVDISNIRGGKADEVIDLEKLRELVSAIAEQRPRAIAIDIVLTPESDPEDQEAPSVRQKLEEEYFEFPDLCLAVRQEKGIPIFLAVADRTVDRPEDWLGGAKYKDLAATIIIPKGETTRIPIWFKAGPDAEKLFSVSAALAKAYRKIQLPTGFAWVVKSADAEFPGTERHLQEDMEYADALVNYSKLEAIQQTMLLTTSAPSVRESGERFRDRMVILGDGASEKAVDTFIVAGRTEPISGVHLHASAAYTFAHEPMYEFRLWTRLALDFLLSLTIIAWVSIQRYRHLGQRRIFHWHKLQNRLVLVFLLGICVLAYLLVRYTGILWLDFLLVMLALWLHPKVEGKFLNSK